MELQTVLEKRRSVRRYLDKPVSKDDLVEIIEAAILAPSWKNSQVTRYYIAQSADVLQQVKEALPEFNYNNVKDAPVLIVTAIVLNRAGFERDGQASNELGNGWGYYDCGLQNMNLLLKASEKGLSTLVMGIRDAEKIKQIFHIPEDQSIVSVIAVGYGAMQPEMPKRKSFEDIVQYY